MAACLLFAESAPDIIRCPDISGAPVPGEDLRYNEFIWREMPQIGVSHARLAKAQKIDNALQLPNALPRAIRLL